MLSAPDAGVEALGLRLRGFVCGMAAAAEEAPRAVRIERLDAARKLVDSVHARLTRPRGSWRSCVAYDASTDWVLTPQETVRICLSDTSAPCVGGGV